MTFHPPLCSTQHPSKSPTGWSKLNIPPCSRLHPARYTASFWKTSLYSTSKSWIINWTTWFGLELQGTTGSVEYNSTLSSVAPLHLRFIVVMEPCFKMSKHGAEITHNATWFVWSEIRVYCASLYDFTRSSLWSHKTLYKTCFFLMQSLSWRPANRRVWIKIRGVVL